MKPLVSVIIPTFNSGGTLEKCLRSISNQTYKNIEIIIVDKFSNDGTKEIAKKYTKKIFEKCPERSTQRNYGAHKSRGKYLLFIDSDMELTKRVIEECVKKQEDTKSSAIIIPEKTVSNNFFRRSKKF